MHPLEIHDMQTAPKSRWGGGGPLCQIASFFSTAKMSEPEMAGIGALIKPNKYNILQFIDLHPGGAAKLSGLIQEDDKLISVDGVLVKDMTAEAVILTFNLAHCSQIVRVELEKTS